MITKASELLSLFIEEEKKKLAGVAMPHMPTLGSAYEEITKQGIDKQFVIPKFLDLRVVKGFISIAKKMLPQQIDCMLVTGEGQQYGLTDQYIYDIDRVLCIFEVKKTLTKGDYKDAFEHLGSIRKQYAEYFEKKLEAGFNPDISSASKAFAQITGEMAPTEYLGMHHLPPTESILFYTLVQEHHAPVSIVHGYEGYGTEKGLRSAFVDILEERFKLDGKGLGVPSLPTLVTSNNFSLIKGNGHPYLAIKDDNSWVVLMSTRHNPARIILELIWAKISRHFSIEMPYGDDLDIENVAPLLIAKPVEKDSQFGWEYHSIELKERSLKREELKDWNPAGVGPAEMSAIHLMFASGGYLPLDSELDEHLKKEYNQTSVQVTHNLIQTRIFAKAGAYLRPVAAVTHLLPNEDDESGYVAIDRNRFDAWCIARSIVPAYMNMVFVE
jgi:hypothetical protein